MGGIDHLRAIKSLELKGYHYDGSYHQEYSSPTNSKATMVRMRPNRRIVGCRPEIPSCGTRWGVIVEAFDGTRAWELNWPKQRLVRGVYKAERAARCGAQFDPLFIDYEARGYRAAYLGEQTLLGVRSIGVRITPPDCPAETFYFHPRTYDLLMKRAAMPVHARGQAVDLVQVIREYRTVAGVKLPSRSEEVDLSDGHVVDGGGWSSMEANTVSDPALFDPPTVRPVGITALVLDLLRRAPGASPAELVRTYADFRRSPEGAAVDTRYDMNWLGYELLKVDNYPAAIAIFRTMLAEDPMSANAHESLGDAYLQKGDNARALAAFEKALALDPARPETARKRDRLR